MLRTAYKCLDVRNAHMNKNLISVFRLSFILALFIFSAAAVSHWAITNSAIGISSAKSKEIKEFIKSTNDLERLREISESLATSQSSTASLLISSLSLIRSIALVLGFVAIAICFLSYRAHKQISNKPLKIDAGKPGAF